MSSVENSTKCRYNCIFSILFFLEVILNFICSIINVISIFGKWKGTLFLAISLSYLRLADFQQIKSWSNIGLYLLHTHPQIWSKQFNPIFLSQFLFSQFYLVLVFKLPIWWRSQLSQWSFDLCSLIFLLCSLISTSKDFYFSRSLAHCTTYILCQTIFENWKLNILASDNNLWQHCSSELFLISCAFPLILGWNLMVALMLVMTVVIGVLYWRIGDF